MTEVLTKRRPCPLCGGSAHEPYCRKAGFAYVRCGSCRLVYVADIPAGNVHFEDEFFTPFDVVSLGANPTRAARMARAVSELRRRFGARRDVRILDVGCGKGWNLLFLKDRGYTAARGIDLNRQALEIARRHGLAVEEGLLEDRRYPDASFDAVIMDQVVEHLEEPLALLREVRRVLAPGGLFWSSVPNVDAWHIRLFLKERHRHFAGDRHLNLFNPRTYARLMAAAGFRARLGTYFEELNVQRLRGLLLHPGDYDHAAIDARRAERKRTGVHPGAVPEKESWKRWARWALAPVNAPLEALTRACGAAAYIECAAEPV